MSFTLTYGDRKSLRAIFDSQYASSETNPPAAMFLDDGPFLVELFPNDWKLPGLKAALDSQHVRQLLSESSLPSPSDKDPLSVDSKIFRYIPHRRCLINYEIRETSIDHHLVGKLFATPEGASRSYETLTLLAANKATADCAPRPITLDQALGLVIMERIEGRQLLEILDDTEARGIRESVIGSAAELLAQIHTLKYNDESPSSMASSGESLRRLHAQIPSRAAATAADIQSALSQLEQLAPQTGQAPEVPSLIHGDFNPRQILLATDRARVVDFDGSGPGDPAQDVGRFTSSLKARAIEAGDPHCRDLAEFFVEKYESASGVSISRRARYFEALGLLYRATRLVVASTFRIVEEPHALIEEASTSMVLLQNSSHR